MIWGDPRVQGGWSGTHASVSGSLIAYERPTSWAVSYNADIVVVNVAAPESAAVVAQGRSPSLSGDRLAYEMWRNETYLRSYIEVTELSSNYTIEIGPGLAPSLSEDIVAFENAGSVWYCRLPGAWWGVYPRCPQVSELGRGLLPSVFVEPTGMFPGLIAFQTNEQDVDGDLNGDGDTYDT